MTGATFAARFAALVTAAWRSRVAGAASLVALSACARGEKRDFIGPADQPPADRSIAQIIVMPTIGTVQIGELIDFLAFGRTSSGDSIGVEVNWRATGGQVSGTGSFSSEAAGSYWIVARSNKQPDKADSAQVLVVGPTDPITRLVISPKSLGMRVGQSRLFSAAAYFGDGTPAAVPIYWTASGGSIDAGGLYTAQNPGDQLIIAVVGNGLTDTARVRVSDVPVLTVLDLLPDSVTVDPGESRQYTAGATWSDGSTTLPPIDFSTTGGVIDSSGLFVAAAPPGEYLVAAQERGGSMVATARVRIRDEGLVAIDITPPSVLLSSGASLRFAAAGRTTSGATRTVNVNWLATGGTITTNGTFVAGSTAGTYRVIATQSGGTLADTAAVVIVASTATLTSLTVSPGSATVAAGDAKSFVVSATWSDGSTAAPSVNWSATGGTITAAGDYTAGITPGAYLVTARHVASGKADTSFVTVTPPRLVSLTVTPGTAAITTNGTQQFTATTAWSDGSTALPPLVWTATVGTVTSTGLYQAGSSPGTFRVIARDNAATVADTSFVTVGSPTPVLQAVVVNPNNVTLNSGEAQQFYVQGVWTNGGTAVPTVVWSATGGTITSGGRYLAGSDPGTYRVIARQQGGTLADTAVVTIQPATPQLIAIVLTPSSATLQPGGSQQFGVQGVWTNGGSGAPAVNFSATGGTITSAGVYLAGSAPGTYRVIAAQAGGTLADTAVVTIGSSPPVLVGLDVTPDGASVVVGGGLQFTAAGIWTNGGVGNPAVSWTATGGSISSGGYYTAGTTAGTYLVVATQTGGTIADTATVYVTSSAVQLTSLRVLPDSVNAQTGVTIEFSVAATWSNGTTTPPPLTWSATGGTVSSSGRYVAGSVPGVYRVIARHSGGTLADTAQARVLSATVTKVNLTPATATIPVGGVQQFAASATWSDGVNRPVAVTYLATGGTITVSGLYTAGQLAGTFMVIANCSCGKSDSSVVQVTGPGGATPTLVSLSINPSAVTLPTNGSQQFSVSGQWSDGSTTTPQVSYSANGGTVSSTGLFTAPAAAGSYRVIATHTGGTLADTAAVTVQSSGGPSPGAWVVEDFSTYTSTADLLSYPNPMWSGVTEDVNTQWMALDPVGPPVGGQSMRYDIPAKPLSDPNLCHDRTIGRNIKFPAQVQEVWIEVYAKFSANFSTVVPGGLCGSTGTAIKFLFGRYTTVSRYNLSIGNANGGYTFGYPQNEQWVNGSKQGLNATMVFDGQWHVWRLHLRAGPTGLAAFAFDGRMIQNTGAVAMPLGAIYGIALGRNQNQGPVQSQTLNWGRISAWRVDPGWGW